MSGPKRGPRSALTVELTPEQRSELERWRRSQTMRVSLVRRAVGILCLSEGASVTDAAAAAQIQRKVLRGWVKRFLAQGVAGLHDSPGRGRKPVFSPGGGDACGEDRLRGARCEGPLALAVG